MTAPSEPIPAELDADGIIHIDIPHGAVLDLESLEFGVRHPSGIYQEGDTDEMRELFRSSYKNPGFEGYINDKDGNRLVTIENSTPESNSDPVHGQLILQNTINTVRVMQFVDGLGL
ncbi:hypothetical protein KQR54_00870 [Mycobacterium gordonae]|uniref:hypothetical protein n=1 Tax=Mycobacterium gordonae TaxID=1778 RepID=UPI00210EA0FE|nr:hypothetical protein [Mycobacterium gordonae]MCQ4359714.1 hypothetical protein [Mycobacterium gordonae]